MNESYEPGDGYLTDEEIAARRPFYIKVRDGCASGCSIDLFVIMVVLALPVWWILN